MSLSEVASETRIPLRSLELLETGKFEDLPADVFVRGFLRSYSRCVGLDADDTVRRYGRLGFEAAPVASEEAAEILEQLRAEASNTSAPPRRRLARGSTNSVDEDVDESESSWSASEWLTRLGNRFAKGETETAEEIETVEADEAPRKEPARIFMPTDFEDESERRGNLTVAVILLAIVATITMSYLMRRPSYSGDGISMDVPALEQEKELV